MVAEMSTPGLLGNISICGPLNINSAAPFHVLTNRPTQSRKMKRKKSSVVDCQRICSDLKNHMKRKFSETLEEQDSEIRPSQSDSQFESTSSQPMKYKKAKITTLQADSWDCDSGFSSETSPHSSGRSSPCIGMIRSVFVAMDCEMVGTGPKGRHSELARCSILNYSGTVIYDKYVLPCQPVTDYRTPWSGIREEHLKHALRYEEALKEILPILKGKIIVGHALYNDFMALGISVPRYMTRDTSSIRLLLQLYGTPAKCVSLKKMSRKLLGRKIQVGKAGHCSVEDALAALDLYKLVEEQWEKSLQAHNSNFMPEPTTSLEHYMQDQYWPESITDCNQ